ncbi:MAG: hypothetical protein GX039_07500, partial [Clostridia bacterium]|nr:hypothetical protein [Clostridia bacterium]
MNLLHITKRVLLLTLVAIFFSGSQALAAPAPQVSTVSPASGPMAGDTVVTINGSGFAQGVRVYFGDNEATKVDFISSTRLYATTPESAVSGRVDVRVVNPDGEQGIKREAFLYNPLLTEVTTGEGRSGSTVGGQEITVKGRGFQNGLTLYLGNNRASNTTVSGDGTTITALTPPGSVGPVAVRVENPDGGTAVLPADSDQTFVYRPSQPQINSFSPTYGPIQGGTEVTIFGQELSPQASVFFGNERAIVVQEDSTTTRLVVLAPPSGSAGSKAVTVRNPDGQAATATTQYNYETLPQILSIIPNYGRPQGGDTVTIWGNNFLALGDKDNIVVTFGGKVATIEDIGVNEQGLSYVKVTTPQFDSLGAVDVEIYSKTEPIKRDVVPRGFTYKSETSQPRIDSITPNSGSVDGGTEVIIKGAGFFSGVDIPLKIFFGRQEATAITVRSSEEIIVITPPSDVTGAVDVTVVNSDGGTATLANGFTYLAPERVLLITGITPNRGSMEGGTPVTVNGANFVDPAAEGVEKVELTIGGNPVQSLSWDAANKAYKGVTPPGYGQQDVVLIITRKVDGRIITEKAILPKGYTYVVPESNPAISSIEPTSGPLSGGTEIRIFGRDFRAPAAPGEELQVFIGNLPATGVRVISSEEIIAITPPSPTTGVRDVTVINPDLATAVLPNAFTYVSSAMSITNVTPNKGPVDRPTRITIYGANFNQDREQDGRVYLVVELGTPEEGYLPAEIVEISDDGSTITANTPIHTAGTKDLVVRNRFGRVTLPGAFTYFVPPSTPQITGIAPASGPVTGGTAVTISGDRFQSGATVTIGGKPAVDVEVVDIDLIRAKTPPGQPGPQDVVVTNPDGGQATLPGGFTYISHPRLDSVTPERGSVAGGTIVTLKGEDFYPGLQVYFGSVTEVVYGVVSGDYQQVAPEEVFVIDRQTAQVRLPAWPEEVDPEKGLKVDIAIVNSDAVLSPDGGFVIAPKAFTYCQPLTSPLIEEITPPFGPAKGGNEVVIRGSGFQPDVQVYFGWKGARVLEVTPSMIRVEAPPNEPGFYDVTVFNAYDTGIFIKKDAYEYRQPLTSPRLKGVFPSSGPASGGTLLTLSGEGFWPGAQVFIGSNEAFLYVDSGGQIVSPEEATYTIAPRVDAMGELIYVHSPEGPRQGDYYLIGPVDVIVLNPDGGTAVLRGGFTYKLPDSSPLIDSLSPNIGTTKGGTPVIISGSDFREGLEVYFGGKKASVNSVSDTAKEVVTPAHDPGLVDVTVVNKDGGVATAYRAFEYRLPGSEPVITSIEPNVGNVNGGTEVTITGEDFRAGVKVYFGGQEASGVVRHDYRTITAITPPGTAGRVDVTVVNPDLGTYTLRHGFTYQSSVPVIEAILPDRGPREGGTRIVIRGREFMAPLQVYFGTEAATVLSVTEGGTLIELTLPPAKDGRLGTVDVKVVNADGATAVRPKGFTYVVPDSQPVIDSIEPDTGSILGGNWATIRGQDFRQDPQVFIGGQPALAVQLIDSQTIRVKMPPHSEGAKDVTVVNYDGGTATLPGGYTYRMPESEPQITKVEPNRGPHLGGTEITVTGLDFRSGVELYIGGAPALQVVRQDYRTITAVTPPGAVGPADVTVVNPDLGTFTLPGGFTYFYVEPPVIEAV